MSHIPLIHGPDGAKLSKRHGALGVDAYRAMGYLPEALRNYLVRLGWSHGDDEIISTERNDRLVRPRRRSAARRAVRFRQAENLNGHYIRACHDRELVKLFESVLRASPKAKRAEGKARRRQRRTVAGDAEPEGARQDADRADIGRLFIFADRPLEVDRRRPRCSPETRILIGQAATRSRPLPTGARPRSRHAEGSQKNNLKLGKVAQPLRVALTGRTTSPGIFDVLAVLGRRMPGRSRSGGAQRPKTLGGLRRILQCRAIASLAPAMQAGFLAPRNGTRVGRFSNDFIGERAQIKQDCNAHGR